ncbi:MAG: DUF2769 domain-containing protein [Candidatus Bathyarchaeota archaeon]|nr:DUF2769 domain-containing protein [Candidatus Bathyarchaeota archaeon]
MSIFRRRKVPLNADVLMKCQCAECPVQAESACTRPKIQKAMDMMNKMSSSSRSSMPAGSMSMQANPPEVEMPKPEELPGPYCSIGVAPCKDLDANKPCICTTCEVYKEYNLASCKPVEHFCFNGRAE